MPHPITKKIRLHLQTQWSKAEAFLQEPTHYPSFREYLSTYRGLPQTTRTSLSPEMDQEPIEGFLAFFLESFLSHQLNLENDDLIELVLKEIESEINLILYYWIGENDRNFQWRTWVHFLECEGKHTSFLSKSNTCYFIVFSENGIYLGKNFKNRLPNILPISKILLPIEQEDTKIFARMRSVQREICMLTDEWEYQNSVLAVEYGQSIHSLQHYPSEETQQAHNDLLKKMDMKRIHYAQFALETFCDIQEWIFSIQTLNNNSDIAAEIDAIAAILLSAVQKILLPASMSRLAYPKPILTLFGRFMSSRLSFCPEDFSAALCYQCTQSAQGELFSRSLFHILTSKPYEWKLCFDPAAFLKAFCWSYSEVHHLLLCSLMGVCYFKKCYSGLLDEIKFSDLLSTYDIQDHFVSYLKPMMQLPTHLSQVTETIDSQQLKQTLQTLLSNNLKKSTYNEEGLELMDAFLGRLP
jgi:hypothetical protein